MPDESMGEWEPPYVSHVEPYLIRALGESYAQAADPGFYPCGWWHPWFVAGYNACEQQFEAPSTVEQQEVWRAYCRLHGYEV
jgi:hypothetical protein